MAIVFDEILSEVDTPTADSAESGSGSGDSQASNPPASRAELQQALERIKIRQLRLMAD